MSKPPSPFRPTLSRLALICSIHFCLFYYLQTTSAIDYIESSLTRPMLFQARDALNKHPPLDPRLKIFSYDDTSADVLGRADLNIRDWALMLAAIADRQPKEIFIDALFALPSGSEAEQQKARKILEKIDVPIITAAFVSPRLLKHRSPLPLGNKSYDALNLYGEKKNVLLHGLVPFSNHEGWYAYGPRESLQPVFANVGHALNAGHGTAQALVRLQRRLIIPHFVLMGRDPLQVRHGQLRAAGQPIPLDRHGRMFVDYVDPEQFYRYAMRMLGILKNVQAKKPVTAVSAGDTVLILPNMLTGSTDFTQTPLGPLPGGFVMASLLNSKIRSDWIKPITGNTFIIAFACAIGGMLIYFSGRWLWLTTTFTVLVWFGTATGIFVYGRTIPDVTTPLLAMSATIMSLIALRHHVREKMAFILRILKTENEELRSEILQAGEISRVFNPERPPKWQDIEIGAFHESLMGASGDWYAFESSPSKRYRHFLMCDITGHGVQAAIVVSACKTVLSMTVHNHPEHLEDPQFLKHYGRSLNRTLFQQGHGRHATTIAAITFDTLTQTISYFCAGHPSPLHLKSENQEIAGLTPLISQNSPLGFFHDFDPEIRTRTYQPGDALIVFTDGASFPRNAAAIKQAVTDSESVNLSLSAKRLCFYLRRRYGTHPNGDDDVSIVWFRFHAVAKLLDETG